MRITRSAAATLATAAAGVSIGFTAFTTPTASAVPCAEWQQMHPGWPCIDTPSLPPTPPPGPPTTPPPLPAPVMPGQAPSNNGGGSRAGALTPPTVGPGNGTPIVPVPGAQTPVLPGNESPAPAAPPGAPTPDAERPTTGPLPPPAVGPPTTDPIRRSDNVSPPTPVIRVTAPQMPSAPVPPGTDSSEPGHDSGHDGRIPLLLLAGAVAFVAPALRIRGGGSSSQQLTITKPWDGGEQTFILMTDPSAPREYRFPQRIPPGGQLRKNPDGTADVLDADGNLVSRTNAPWAYDALGRAVRTWYDVDGDTIVQHIEPDADNVFPILADPDTVPSCTINSDGKGGTTTSSSHADGSVYTTHEDANGNLTTALSTPVPNSGGTVDTRITNADGTTTDMRSVPNGRGAVTTWTQNPDGSNSVAYPPSPEHPGGYIVKDPGTSTTTPAETVELQQGGQAGHVTEYNLDGTTSEADFRPGVLGPVTDITNPDGTHTQVTTTGGTTNGRPGSIITQDDGSRFVIEPDGTAVPIDRYNNAIGGSNYNNQYDPITGTWHSDPVTHRGPIIAGTDGTATQEWFFRGKNGEDLSATAYFDKNGNLTSVRYADYTGIEITTFQTVDGVSFPTGTSKLDAGNVIDNADLVFNAVLAVTGIPELGYTAGRMLGGQLLSRGVGEAATAGAGAAAAADLPAASYSAKIGLSEQLTFEEAASIFNADGTLTPAILGESRLIMPGESMGNQALINELTANGSRIVDWAKFSTPTVRGPSGDFQVHFYRNTQTCEIFYGRDYKAKFN